MIPTTEISHWLWSGGAGLLFLLVCTLCLWPRRRAVLTACDVLVIYASQTGQAEAIARRGQAELAAGGIDAQVRSLGAVTPTDLAAARTILVVASTTGEGDAPDEARAFEARGFTTRPDLSKQSFAVLALGDRKYDQFCAFGLRLHTWLETCGARPLAPCLTVDDLDRDTLQSWNALVTQLGGTATAAEAPPPLWTLTARDRLNPEGSAPLSRLAFVPQEPQSWAAGDLVEVVTRGGHLRDYSIASLPDEGHLILYVREVIGADGTPGYGSGMLLHDLAVGDVTGLRLKSHKGFHAPAGDGPVLLIGAGSGLAGLRPHILQSRRRQSWVIYGERHPQRDGALVRDLEALRDKGMIKRLTTAFSQPDNGANLYVQDALAAEGARVTDHLTHDGAVMVCGGLDMGRAVEKTLRGLMGDAWVDQALSSGRYRRDLY